MWKHFLPVFALLAVAYCGGVPQGPIFPFTTFGNSGSQTTYLSNGNTLHRFSAIAGLNTQDNTDAVNDWFNLFFDNVAVGAGGISENYADLFPSLRQDHFLVAGYSPFKYVGNILAVDTTFRFDAQGWATILWEITNTGSNPITTYLNNNNADIVGAGVDTSIYSTSDGDPFFEATDDWAIIYDSSGSDPIVGLSFGKGNLLDDQGGSLDVFFWGSNQNFLPGETRNILQVLAVGNHAPDVITVYDFRTMQYRLHSVLTLERNFYNYITADGYGLLDHLTYQQLFNTVNWNFIGAGIAPKLESDSETRVVRLDGSVEQITPEPGVYCLFEDRVAQVNFRLSSSGVVDEVVVFAREHRLSFHASLDLNGQPEFLIDGQSVEIPMSRLDGNLVTESAPFQVPFTHIPLSALGEYHVNSLHFRDVFTVVGGYHPELGGFFNVAVHRRATENRFPGLLNVPHGSQLRDVGISSSIVPDIWFDLSQ